ncbi:MAG: N-acetyltransferase [Planctomycetota bacterium]
MQFDLRGVVFEDSIKFGQYRFHAWKNGIIGNHAEAKYLSFRNEMDANVFPCLGDAEGCHRLMRDISNRNGFLPEATWLATYEDPDGGRVENCGTIQGIRESVDLGSIQNIGIVEHHRGKGIGSRIVRLSLKGFQQCGIRFVNLEVTVKNTGALRLYENLGFKIIKTVFKSAEIGNYD